MTSEIHWTKYAAQQLVRYEALFNLLDDIQGIEDVDDLVRRVAAQWKYFTDVTSWRLVVENDGAYLVIDGRRGEARVAAEQALSPWDRHHWNLRRPQRVPTAAAQASPAAPTHLATDGITEILVLPFMRIGRCAGLLSAASRREPFSELDLKFIRIFSDIDFFKHINDHYGHDVGDEVLREVSRRLQAQTRASDSLARYGGEEFLIVLYPCTVEEVALAAERVRTAIAATPFVIAGDPPVELSVTISLGTASTADQTGIPIEHLLKQADEAMYRSKAGGRNRVTAATRGDAPAREA
jgi:diguanylate cyclase (GGDEF)-like protein